MTNQILQSPEVEKAVNHALARQREAFAQLLTEKWFELQRKRIVNHSQAEEYRAQMKILREVEDALPHLPDEIPEQEPVEKFIPSTGVR